MGYLAFTVRPTCMLLHAINKSTSKKTMSSACVRWWQEAWSKGKCFYLRCNRCPQRSSLPHLWTSTLVASPGFCWMTSSSCVSMNRGVLSLLCVGKGNTIILNQLLWWWFIALLLLTNIYKSPYTTLYSLKSSICICTLKNLNTEFTPVCFEDPTLTVLWRWRLIHLSLSSS
jgi:hypothetical protein